MKARLLAFLARRLRIWRWPARLQLEHLRVQLQQDARWLASDPTAAALTQRYLDLVADDWMTRPVQDIRSLREQLELARLGKL